MNIHTMIFWLPRQNTQSAQSGGRLLKLTAKAAVPELMVQKPGRLTMKLSFSAGRTSSTERQELRTSVLVTTGSWNLWILPVRPDRTALMGYSAGGHIAAGAAMLLRDRGVKLTTQVLGYPFLNFIGFNCADYTGFKGALRVIFNRFAKNVLFEKMPKDCALLSPANAAPELLKGLAPAVIVSCGKGDPLLPQAEAYAEKLKAAGVPTVYREVKEAIHGFLEHNFKDDPAVFANEGEQDRLMREAVEFSRMRNIFDGSVPSGT